MGNHSRDVLKGPTGRMSNINEFSDNAQFLSKASRAFS